MPDNTQCLVGVCVEHFGAKASWRKLPYLLPDPILDTDTESALASIDRAAVEMLADPYCTVVYWFREDVSFSYLDAWIALHGRSFRYCPIVASTYSRTADNKVAIQRRTRGFRDKATHKS